jgi:hypothetical protein
MSYGGRRLSIATAAPRFDWQQKNIPAASYREIKNYFGDEEKASPVSV